MGFGNVFGPNANFTNMIVTESSNPPLSISNFIHKAIIEINESGTTAAAASGIKYFTIIQMF